MYRIITGLGFTRFVSNPYSNFVGRYYPHFADQDPEVRDLIHFPRWYMAGWGQSWDSNPSGSDPGTVLQHREMEGPLNQDISIILWSGTTAQKILDPK